LTRSCAGLVSGRCGGLSLTWQCPAMLWPGEIGIVTRGAGHYTGLMLATSKATIHKDR